MEALAQVGRREAEFLRHHFNSPVSADFDANSSEKGLKFPVSEEFMRPTPDFIGRERELAKLKRLLDSPSAEIAVLYGRRRVGKTLLLEHVLTGRNALFFEALEDRPKKEQIDHFLY